MGLRELSTGCPVWCAPFVFWITFLQVSFAGWSKWTFWSKMFPIFYETSPSKIGWGTTMLWHFSRKHIFSTFWVPTRNGEFEILIALFLGSGLELEPHAQWQLWSWDWKQQSFSCMVVSILPQKSEACNKIWPSKFVIFWQKWPAQKSAYNVVVPQPILLGDVS